jgi:Xaa-Pro aminopeptidase
MNYKERLKKLRIRIKDLNLDGFIVSNEFNRRYMSGFTGTTGVLFIDSKDAFIITDSRYYIQVKQQCPDFKLMPQGTLTPFETLIVKKSLQGKSIGFEADTVSAATLKRMKKTLKGIKLVPTEQILIKIRAVKSENEVQKIRQAQAITDKCFKMILDTIKPGMTEKQVAWMMEKFHREHGASADSFPAIVASGPNSAMPHAFPTDRKLLKNEPVLFDFGCLYDGYCSDMTRVVFLGKPSKKFEAIYNRVLETHLMVFELSKPGASVAEIDRVSRDYVYKTTFDGKPLMGEKKGQGRYEHGLGHGVGLEIHELPVLSYKIKKGVLEPGNIVTDEPGIYIEGEGGVRIEDIMHVTRDDVESLTGSPKELIVL